MMGKTPEAKVRDPVVAWAKAHRIGHQRMSFRIGVKQAFPDDVFLIPGGYTIYFEFKAPGKEPTALQLHRLESLHELGFIATWSDNSDEARAFLSHALDAAAVSAPCRGLPYEPLRGRAALKAWRAQNFYYPGRIFTSLVRRQSETNARSSPFARVPPDVAPRGGEVD